MHRGGNQTALSEKSMKRIGAVIDTLDDILASIESEEEQESANVGKFLQWCKDNSRSMAKALDQAKRDLEEASTADKELTASVEGLEHTLGELTAETEETQDMVDQSQTRRDEENAKYTEDMQMNSQSLNQIAQAIGIVGKVHGEGGLLQRDLEQGGHRQELQLYRPGESRLVLGVMKGLQARLEKTRDEMKASEAQKEEMHQKLMSTKKAQLAALSQESTEKKQMKREVQLELVEVKAHAKGATKTIKSTTALLEQTTSECSSKNQSWTVRSADREREKATIHQAIDVLVSLQSSEATLMEAKGEEDPEDDSSEDDPDTSVANSFLQRGQRRQGSSELRGYAAESMRQASARGHKQLSGAMAGRALQMLARAQGGGEDNMDASKKVVNDLIAVLEQQAIDEAETKKYCEAELTHKYGARTEVEDTLKSLEAAIDYKTTEVESFENKVKATEEAVHQMKDNLEVAQGVRKSEHKAYEASARDRALAVKVLKQAKEVLRQFYETQDATALNTTAASLLAQAQAAPNLTERPETFTHSSRKDVASQGVLDLMDMIAEGIHKEQDAADSAEREAAGTFAALAQETQENEDHMWQEITEWVKLKAKLAVRLNIDKETWTQRRENHEAIQGQISTLHEHCDDLLSKFDQRVKARDFELSQLKDVLDILAGSSIAPRTGLAQQQSTLMSKRELALLSGLTSEAA